MGFIRWFVCHSFVILSIVPLYKTSYLFDCMVNGQCTIHCIYCAT